MDDSRELTVEFFGVPRHRAGRAELRLPAGTLAEVLAALEQACPELAGLVVGDRLAPHYLLSLDGQRFLTDLGQRLHVGDRLLLLTADAGG